MVMPDPFLLAQRERIVSLASRHALVGIILFLEFVEVGGLISYGTRVGGPLSADREVRLERS